MNNENATNKDSGTVGKNYDLFRKYILNNIGIKILSILVAIIVWMVIINIEDPYKEKVFTVSVETINEDALKSVNKVFEVIEGSVAQVKVRGKKSVVDKLKATDIRATADLSDLSAVNAVSIVPTLTKNVSSEPVLECNQVLKVSLEDMSKKQVKVTVVTEGTPEEGFSIGECTARPNMVEVTGGQSAISKIDSVRVTINVNGASQDFTRRQIPTAYDTNGEEVVSSTLTYSVSRIKATVRVLQTKTIPVNIKIKGTPAKGFEFVEADCLPEKIEVAGTSKALDTINEVEIPIDITGMKSSSGSIEQNISIQDYLPDGVNVLSDYAQVSLRIELEKQVKRTLSVPTDTIKFASLDDNLQAQITENDDSVQIVVQGRSSVLEDLPSTAFTAYVDCEGLKVGSYDLEVQFDLGDTCTLVNSEKVSVRILKKKSSDSSATSPVPKETVKPSSAPAKTEEPDSDQKEEEEE